MRLLEQVEVLPGHQLGAHPVEDRLARAARAARRQPAAGVAARRDQDRHRSPSRIAARRRRSRSGEPRQPSPAVQRGEPAVRRGLPAPGVAAVHDVVVDQRAGLEELERGRGGHDARRRPRRRRRASPSSRTPAAAACRRASRSVRASTSGPRSSLDVVEDRDLAGRKSSSAFCTRPAGPRRRAGSDARSALRRTRGDLRHGRDASAGRHDRPGGPDCTASAPVAFRHGSRSPVDAAAARHDHPRAAGVGGAVVLVRVLPAQDRGGRAPALGRRCASSRRCSRPSSR